MIYVVSEAVFATKEGSVTKYMGDKDKSLCQLNDCQCGTQVNVKSAIEDPVKHTIYRAFVLPFI